DLPFDPEFAVQNSPRLIEGAGQLGIHHDDGKRASRTAVCVRGARLDVLVALAPPREGPTLYETARLLGDLGCQAALNLDGGPSSGLWLRPDTGIASSAPLAPIAYGIAVVPR